MKNRSRVIFILILCVLLCSNNGFNFGLRIHDMGFTYHFNPAKISDLALWLDASDSSSITLNGSNVSGWDDKSGNENHATQGTADWQPAYTQQINGLNVITCAASDHLNISYTYSEATTLFLVTKKASTPAYIIRGNDSASSPYIISQFNPGDGVKDFEFAISNFGGSNYRETLAESTDSNLHVLSVIHKDSSTAMGFFDGVLQYSLGDTGVFIDGRSFLSLGGIPNTYVGPIAEFIIYERELSESQYTAVGNYLINKWGI